MPRPLGGKRATTHYFPRASQLSAVDRKRIELYHNEWSVHKMAATKSRVQQAADKARKAPKGGVPDGFQVIELDMPSVQWQVTPEVMGTVTGHDVFHSDKGPKRVLIVNIDGEATRLIEQGGLRRLFDHVCVGDDVLVRSTGTRPLEGGRTLRLFEGAIKPGQKRTPIPHLPVEVRRGQAGGAANLDDDIPF